MIRTGPAGSENETQWHRQVQCGSGNETEREEGAARDQTPAGGENRGSDPAETCKQLPFPG